MAKRARHHAGFLLADAVGALLILSVLTAALATVVHRQARALAKLADRRVAGELAERTLVNLQLGRSPAVPAEATAAGTHIEFHAAKGGDPLAGRMWIVVRVERNGQAAEVVGLAPAGTGGTP